MSFSHSGDDSEDDVLGVHDLRREGARILETAPGLVPVDQVWIDTSREPGAAWLIQHADQDVLRVQRFAGICDVDVPAGVFEGCRHYELERLEVSTRLVDRSPKSETRVALYLAMSVGPVKIVAPSCTYLLSMSVTPATEGELSAFSDLPLPEMPDLGQGAFDPASVDPASVASGADFVAHDLESDGASATGLVEPAKVVPIQRSPDPVSTSDDLEGDAADSWWPRLSVYVGPRTRMIAGIALLVVIGWLLVRTSTRAGLKYHEVGADGPAPTVLVLHGYGAPGTDFVPFAERIVEQLDGVRVICVEAPYGVGFGNAWYLSDRQRRRSRDQLGRFIAELEEEGTPRDQIVIAGFSQGAAMAADVSVHVPGLAGVGILSGDHSTREPLDGRVFVSHGRGDSVLSFNGVERHVAGYEETAEVTFVPFDGGHEARSIEPDFIRWVGEALEPASLSAR